MKIVVSAIILLSLSVQIGWTQQVSTFSTSRGIVLQWEGKIGKNERFKVTKVSGSRREVIGTFKRATSFDQFEKEYLEQRETWPVYHHYNPEQLLNRWNILDSTSVVHQYNSVFEPPVKNGLWHVCFRCRCLTKITHMHMKLSGKMEAVNI